MKKVITLVIISLGVFSCKTIYLNQNDLIFPTKLSIIQPDDNIEEYWLQNSKGDSINTLLFKHPSSKKVILFFHGNSRCIWEDYAFAYFKGLRKEFNINVFAIDYNGFGKSTGEATRANFIESSTVSYDYLVNELNYSPDSIIILAHSLGTSVAANLSSQRHISTAILIGSFTNTKDVVKQWQKSIPFPKSLFIKLEVPDSLNIDSKEYLLNTKNKAMRLLFIHGSEDKTTPLKLAKKLYSSIPLEHKELLIIKGIGHHTILLDSRILEKMHGYIN